MTVITSIKRAPVIADKKAALTAPAKPFAFKGRNAVVRTAALQGIASLAYVEGKSRADVIAQLRIALGNKPTEPELNAAKLEYIVGRAAQRLATPDLPTPDMTIADRIDFARKLATQYAYPVKDGVKARPLRKGQLGRRTISQHKVMRAAEEAWSLIKADCGLGEAQGMAAKKAKEAAKRSPAMAGTTARGKVAPAGLSTLAQLATPLKALSKADAINHVTTQAASLLAFANKNAALLPTAFGLSIKRFKAAIDQIANEDKLASK